MFRCFLSSKTKRYYELAPELKLYNWEFNKRIISIEHGFGNLKTSKFFLNITEIETKVESEI